MLFLFVMTSEEIWKTTHVEAFSIYRQITITDWENPPIKTNRTRTDPCKTNRETSGIIQSLQRKSDTCHTLCGTPPTQTSRSYVQDSVAIVTIKLSHLPASLASKSLLSHLPVSWAPKSLFSHLAASLGPKSLLSHFPASLAPKSVLSHLPASLATKNLLSHLPASLPRKAC